MSDTNFTDQDGCGRRNGNFGSRTTASETGDPTFAAGMKPSWKTVARKDLVSHIGNGSIEGIENALPLSRALFRAGSKHQRGNGRKTPNRSQQRRWHYRVPSA